MNTLPKFSALGLVITASLLATTAFAINLPGQAANRFTNDSTTQTVPYNRPSQTPGGSGNGVSQASTARQAAQGRLQDAKLKACQARESAITNRSVHLGQLATTMERNFDAIATRVEEYYTTKVVPTGKTVTNYSSLVADIQTNKTAVQTAVTKAQAGAAGFSCSGDDPKGQLTQYRVDMQAVIKALQGYRTSVKNLIVAVHSVVGETNSAQNQASQSGQRGGNQ